MTPLLHRDIEAAMAGAMLRMLKAQPERMAAPTNDDELWTLIRDLWGYTFARVAVCPDHCAPFDFVSDIFFQRVRKAIAMGSRGSGKTLADAVLHVLIAAFHEPAPWDVHVGAIQNQADRGGAYVDQMLGHPKLAPLVSTTRAGLKTFKRGSKIEVLTGTIKQMSGPHPQRASADEIEWWDWQSYQQFQNMLSSKDGTLPQIWLTSTRQRPRGIMQRLIDAAPASEMSVYSWCVLENIDGSKPSDKGGCQPCVQSACLLWSDCRTCQCEEPCEHPGRAVNARGFMLREEVIDKLQLAAGDRETWMTQQLSQRPGTSGLTYPEFDHQNISEGAEYTGEGRFYFACDEGWTDPNVILFVEEQPNGDLFVFNELYRHEELPDDTVKLAIEMCPDGPEGKRKPRRAYPDPSGTYMREALRKAGIPVELPKEKDVLAGIKRVRRRIRGIRGRRTLLVHPRCQRFIFEMQNMAQEQLPDGTYSDLPDKDDPNQPDHGPDAIRYLITCRDTRPTLAHGGKKPEATNA